MTEIKMIQDHGPFKKGDIIEFSTKDAENYINEGIAILVEKKNVEVVETILSPSQIGDGVFQYPISETCKVQAGRDQAEFFIRVLNKDKVVWEKRNGKNLVRMSSVKKELYSTLIDLDFLSNSKNSKKIVSGIFAYFLPLLYENKGVTSATCVTSVLDGGQTEQHSTSFFSLGTIPQKPTYISCGNGIINNQYYFGAMIPEKKPIFDRAGKYSGEENDMGLILIMDNQNPERLTKSIKDRYNIKCKNDRLSNDNSRWSYTKMREYVNDKEQYKYLSPQELFEKIQASFLKHIHFNEKEHYDILPLWVLGTYIFPLFQAFPYINLWGLKNTGKTKVMQLSSILSFNSVMLVNISPAALFRIVEQDNPSLFIDEAEMLFDEKNKSEDTSSLVSMFNSGWMRGAYVYRVEKNNDRQEVAKYNVYCPKMLGSIKGIRGALESRCINIVMVRSTNALLGDTWPKDHDEELMNIRDEIYPFMLKNWKEIRDLYNENSDFGIKKEFNLSNRDWQVWKPLLCIAKLISDDLYQRVGLWAVESTSRGSEDDDGDGWDNKISEALTELVTYADTKEYYVKELKDLVDKKFIERIFTDAQGNESPVYQKMKPSSSYIGRFLNKIGLNKFRKRIKGKVVYFLKKSDVLWSLEASNVVAPVDQVDQVAPSFTHKEVPPETITIEPSLPVEDKEFVKD